MDLADPLSELRNDKRCMSLNNLTAQNPNVSSACLTLMLISDLHYSVFVNLKLDICTLCCL